MRSILNNMTSNEQTQYKNYINEFTQAMKFFCGVKSVEAEDEQFYNNLGRNVEGYIQLMRKYIPDLKLHEELGNQAIRFFVIQEVNRVYVER